MPKFRVMIPAFASAEVDVEAEDADDAVEKAVDAELPYLCARCSGCGQDAVLELCEWDWANASAEELPER